MNDEPNVLERGYKRIDSGTVLTLSLEEWVPILISLLPLIVPRVTGLPAKYTASITFFILQSSWILVARKFKEGKVPLRSAFLLVGLGTLGFYLLFTWF